MSDRVNYERFSVPISPAFPEEWYDLSGSDHFWLVWRLRVLQKLLQDHTIPIDRPLHALEIGCGRAVLRSQVEALTDWVVDGADINESALRRAVGGRGRTLLYDIYDRRQELREVYDVVILFDVLEHIRERKNFLEASWWHLKPGGWMILNVPAFMMLYSRYDEAAGHFLRYDRQSMRCLFQLYSSQLEILDLRYWGIFMLPLALLRKFILRTVRKERIIETGFKPPAGWVNTVLQATSLVETSFLRHPPFGTSLMVLARRMPG